MSSSVGAAQNCFQNPRDVPREQGCVFCLKKKTVTGAISRTGISHKERKFIVD